MANKKEKKSAQKSEKTSKIAANNDANKATIENHKNAAAHHMEAAKHHIEAAKNHEAGEHEKAAHNTMLAYGHSAIAGGFLSDDAKLHAQALKQTKYE